MTLASWALFLAMCGLFLATFMLASVRLFARDHGLEYRRWSRSYAADRKHLRKLAQGDDPVVALSARRYLLLEIAARVVHVLSILAFFWGATNRFF
jgi:hypothetical protein